MALAEPVGTFNVVREAAVLSNLARQTADITRTQQKRHARRLATYPWHPNAADLQAKLCRE